MSYIYKICGKLSMVFYIATLYQFWHLCQYGGLRSHVFQLAAVIVMCACTFLIWGIGRKRDKKDDSGDKPGKRMFYIELAVIFAATLFFGGRIIYSAIPYNGALSWKMYEWTHKKEVTLEHNNLYESGVEGILSDLEEELKLPENLYISGKFQIDFDETGKIQRIDTFLYGQDKKGEKNTYLVEYNIKKSDAMTVWIDGNVNGEYEEDMRLSPMLEILKKADWKNQVNEWAGNSGQSQIYEILYMGRRAFQTEEGLQYIEGNAKEQEGYGVPTGNEVFQQLRNGGEIVGFEVSLHMPEAENVTPVRYMMEPEYISPDTISQNEQAEKDSQAKEQGKENNTWTVDTDGSGVVRFFLNEQKGWKLSVVDAALGTRYYKLETTSDGGYNWTTVNEDPFDGNGGVGEGIQFFDEQFGFIGLSGASQTHSSIYVTKDGGKTLKEIELPMDTVTEYPLHMQEYGFTLEDYQYLEMPQQDGENYTIHVMTQSGETEGLVFTSEDQGENWIFTGVFDENDLS